MRLSRIEKTTLFLIALTLFISLISYPFLPAFIASHWNMAGQADGFSQKAFALFAMPLVSVVIFIFVLTLPKSPKKTTKTIHDYYDLFVLGIIAFLLFIQTVTILWNLGVRVHLAQFLAIIVALLLFYVAETSPVKIKTAMRFAGIIAFSGVILKTISLVIASGVVIASFLMIYESDHKKHTSK